MIENEINRRDFIKASSLSSIGLIISMDPFVSQLAKALEIDPDTYGKGFDHYCAYTRPEDLMHLFFYFVNLEHKRGKLRKIRTDQPAFMVVRLPQQHIGEDLVQNHTDVQDDTHKKAFVSGFSWLSFKIESDDRSFPYTPEFLLNWNNFKLITLAEAKGYPKYDIAVLNREKGTYPLDVSTISGPRANDVNPLFYRTPKGIEIPLTLFEVPYKMFLSPIEPDLDERTMRNQDFKFSSDNKPAQLLRETRNSDKKSQTQLFSLWNNNLLYRVLDKDGQQLFVPPSFKIPGYANPDKYDDKNVELLPFPLHREQLANLTQLPAKDNSRDVLSQYFNFSGLGTSTFLEYANPNPKDQSIVGWKQKTKLGRDNYVEVTFRAIDSNSGLKVLVSIIAERHIRNGISYLKKRYYFKYQETLKTFNTPVNINRIPVREIRALEKGSFFSPFEQDGKKFFVALKEESQNYPVDLLKFSYLAIDRNGKEHQIKMDLILIPGETYEITSNSPNVYKYELDDQVQSYSQDGIKKVPLKHIGQLRRNGGYTFKTVPYKKYAATTLNDINSFKAKNEANHVVRFSEKLAFANSDKENVKGENSTNTEFETEGAMFYSVFGGEYKDAYPLYPRLFYAKVFLPQLESIESVPRLHNVAYSRSYFDHGFGPKNTSKIFLKMLNPSVSAIAFTQDGPSKMVEQDIADAYNDLFFNKIEALQKSVKNSFTENYKNIGSMINPDVEIEGVSLEKQGLVLKEKMDQLSRFNPADILGLNAEIIGSIKLRDILEEVLDIEDLPITKTIEDASKAIDDLRNIFDGQQQIFREWQAEYNEYKTLLDNLPQQIKALERQLVNQAQTAIAQHIRKEIEKTGILHQAEIIARDIENHITNKVLTYYEANKVIYDKIRNEVKDISDKLETEKQNLTKALDTIKKFEETLDETIRDEYNNAQKLLRDTLSNLILKSIQIHENKILGGSDIKRVLRATAIVYFHFFYSILKDQIEKNLKPFLDALNELKAELEAEAEVHILVILDTANEVYAVSQANLEEVKAKAKEELRILKKGLTEELRQLKDNLETELLKSEAVTKLRQTTTLYLNHYNEVQAKINEIEAVAREFDINQEEVQGVIDAQKTKLKELEGALIKKLKNEATVVLIEYEKQLAPYQAQIKELEEAKFSDVLSNVNKYKKQFQQLESDAIDTTVELEMQADAAKQQLVNELNDIKSKLNDTKQKLDDFIGFKLRELEQRIREDNAELIRRIEEGQTGIEQLESDIAALKKLVATLRIAGKKEINYSWNTKRFRDRSFGIAKFLKRSNPDTELAVDFQSSTKYKINLNQTPKVEKQDIRVINRFSNFGINFLNLITVNFDEVRYQNGNNIKEDFSVKIRDIEFDGVLNFVEVFQKYLKSIDKNLILEINSRGADLGYMLPLPNIILGYINFVNLRFSMGIHLPFQPGLPMLMKFGINAPSNRFVVTVKGFPGTGYLQITANPKQGITSIAFLIEFGAHFYFNFGVAKGHAYIYAGIYFIKRYNKVTVKGYLICSGNLRVLGLFNASVTFHLLLKGNGRSLTGRATLRVSYRFSRWFKVSARISMYKRILGAKDNGAPDRDDKISAESVKRLVSNSLQFEIKANFATLLFDDIIMESNVLQTNNIHLDDELYVIVSSDTAPTLLLNNIPSALVESTLLSGESESEKYYKLSTQITETGMYSLQLKMGNDMITLSESVQVWEEEDDALGQDQIRRKDWKAYFNSYYYKP